MLVVPSGKMLPTLGGKAFCYVAPKLWNNLPSETCNLESLSNFQCQMKTYLLKQTFNLQQSICFVYFIFYYLLSFYFIFNLFFTFYLNIIIVIFFLLKSFYQLVNFVHFYAFNLLKSTFDHVPWKVALYKFQLLVILLYNLIPISEINNS